MLIFPMIFVSLMLQKTAADFPDTVGRGTCLPEVVTDILGLPRPSRAPDTLFPGDTGCDIGAYQYNPKAPAPVITITISPSQ